MGTRARPKAVGAPGEVHHSASHRAGATHSAPRWYAAAGVHWPPSAPRSRRGVSERRPPWKAPLRGPCPLRFKKAWKDGSRGLVLTPEDLLVRLCAAMPPPRFHMVRYFGVLSSHSAFRSRVVPEPPEDTTAHRPPPAAGDQLELLGEEDDRAPKALRHRWAWLLAHIFAADLECCPRCGGAMRWAEVAKTKRAALRLMAKLGLAPHPPPDTPATPLGQLSLQFTGRLRRLGSQELADRGPP